MPAPIRFYGKPNRLPVLFLLSVRRRREHLWHPRRSDPSVCKRAPFRRQCTDPLRA